MMSGYGSMNALCSDSNNNNNNNNNDNNNNTKSYHYDYDSSNFDDSDDDDADIENEQEASRSRNRSRSSISSINYCGKKDKNERRILIVGGIITVAVLLMLVLNFINFVIVPGAESHHHRSGVYISNIFSIEKK
mmetsp:Transcript_43308/g.46999  ORF Transcript_43308/g.46999 Transcript_43308/m.46999 type:complete len:134 (+) Transcript_43308:252-653(+)